MAASWILEAVGRWAVYVPALALLGLPGAARLLVETPHATAGGPPTSAPEPRSRLWRLALGLALGLIAATLLRAWCQTWNVFGFEDGSSLESLRLVALESRWGGRFRWQPLAAGVILVGVLLERWSARAGWVLIGGGGLGLAAALPLTGHAAGKPLEWAAQSVHVLGSGAWLGTLAMIGLIKLTAPGLEARPLLRRFAPLATTGVVAVVGAGGLLAWRSLPTVESLWSSSYGRMLLVKLALVIVVLVLGASNFLRLRRDPAPGPLPAAVWFELAAGALTIVATGILTSLSPP